MLVRGVKFQVGSVCAGLEGRPTRWRMMKVKLSSGSRQRSDLGLVTCVNWQWRRPDLGADLRARWDSLRRARGGALGRAPTSLFGRISPVDFPLLRESPRGAGRAGEVVSCRLNTQAQTDGTFSTDFEKNKPATGWSDSMVSSNPFKREIWRTRERRWGNKTT